MQLEVKSGSACYPIYIGNNLLQNLTEHLSMFSDKRKVIITDDNVAKLYATDVCKSAGVVEDDVIVFSNGEEHKSLNTCEYIYRSLLERAVTRDALVLALGGGVVGDTAGFIAATYLRGVDYVQLPTTLLAQVDSAVGGKTAVNHPLGKNMIGAFYHPKAVISDVNTLATLSQRDFVASLAEIIKYGLILDNSFFVWLEKNVQQLIEHNEEALAYAISESCRIKAEVVNADEFERSGHRALLNLGHTFGHAIESCLGYGEWLHGEAVGCGIVLATHFSLEKRLIDEETANRAIALIKQVGLPITVPKNVSLECLIKSMRVDKKNLRSHHRLILLKGIGNAFVDDDWTEESIKNVLSRYIS